MIIFSGCRRPRLIAMGARQLIGAVTIKTIPIVGEWQAAGKPWRIVFRPDKTIASFLVPRNQARPLRRGVYSIDYFWNAMGEAG